MVAFEQDTGWSWRPDAERIPLRARPTSEQWLCRATARSRAHRAVRLACRCGFFPIHANYSPPSLERGPSTDSASRSTPVIRHGTGGAPRATPGRSEDTRDAFLPLTSGTSAMLVPRCPATWSKPSSMPTTGEGGAMDVAVRSSATAEDLPDASFAGQAGDVSQRARPLGVARCLTARSAPGRNLCRPDTKWRDR
jgi:hypothetical protein